MTRRPGRLPPNYTTRAQAGLDQPAAAPAPIGDNHPPEEIEAGPPPIPAFSVEDIVAGLKARSGACAASALEIQMLACDLPETMPADDQLDEALDKLATFELAGRAADRLIDTARAAEKAPYLDGTRAVDDYFRPWLSNIEAHRKAARKLKDQVAARVSTLAREAAAIQAAEARAEAAKKAEEAQALADRGLNHVADTVAQDAARLDKAADRAEKHAEGSIRTASGVSVAVTAVWTGTITDYAALRAACGPLGLYFTDPVLEMAVRAAVKAGARELPGVKISEHQTSGAR